jgi:formylglycine-generating enzyme required for sulfatase activity
MRTLLISCITAFLLLPAFSIRKKAKPKLPEEFVYVPGGGITIDTGECGGCQACGISVFVHSFYMSKYEVSNLQYRQFFAEVSQGMTDEAKEMIACDSMGWRQVMSVYDPMMEYYFRHPAYNNYPVVNISYEGATRYCEWLQQKIQQNNPDFEVEVQLPGRYHWIYAARGGRSQAIYPWAKYYLRNKKGEPMCNFKLVADHAIVKNRETGLPVVAKTTIVRSLFTSPVKSFYPNDFGLYNMSGNAAEMVREKDICMGGSWNDYGGDVTTRSEASYDVSAPTVGFRPIIRVKSKAVENKN